MIHKGDKVRIKPEWQDAGDEDFTFVAVDDEDKGRVTIEPQIPGLKIKPTQVVRLDMIEKVD